MTRQEFIDRTGMNLSNERFEQIQDVYLNAGNLDKDAFCEDFKKHSDSLILNEYTKQTGYWRNTCLAAKGRCKDAATILIGKSRVYNDPDLYREAVKLIGQKNALLTTLELGLPLCDEEIAFIKENLK